MKKRNSILAILLGLTVVVSLFVFFIAQGQTAEASTSLPGIEEIKQTSDTFKILEIVPQAGSGSIGWYVAGQEPGANWAQDRLASLPSSDRTSTANAYLTSLETDGLLGAAGTPLFKTGDYVEYTPWAVPSGATNLKTLNLSSEEVYHNVPGSFTEATVGGEYRADNSYSVHSGGVGGDYDQDITGLTLLSGSIDDGNTHYYYTLGAFSPLSAFSSVEDGLLIYHVVDYVDDDGNGVMDDPYDITIDASTYAFVPAADVAARNPSTLIFLAFQGCMGSSDLTGLNLLASYFTVPFTVSTTYGTAPQFEPTANGFVKVNGGYGHFDAVTLSYTYVGPGATDADYSYSSTGSDTYTINTKTIFYSGGFTNNNWFLTYVFDWVSGETAPAITVKSVTPGSVTETDVSDADLIVLSSGRGTITTPYASASNDISSTIAADIVSASGSKMPIIVDNALRSQTGLQIGQLAAALATSASAHYVSNNIYCTNTALATSSFNSEISGDHESTGDPFYPVWYEINYENFLRTQNDPEAVTLPETVSIATCVRYVVNYGGQRIITSKTSIRVLELEPGAGKHLTASTVSGWTGIPADHITIDAMSTAEYIGKINDLVETYDLVYIGSDLTGISTFPYDTTISNKTYLKGTTKYTDTDMNGLIYTNIGDLYLSGYNLTGLLNRDYGSYSSYYKCYVINSSDTSRTYRLSGNDITQSKVNELLDFAAAGYPVVVADGLMSGTPAMDAFSFTAEITDNDGTLNASAVATAGSSIPYGVTKTYAWYKAGSGGDSLIPSSGSSYTPDETGTYYCTITISGQTATSNTADVTVARVYTATPRTPSNAVSGDYSYYKTYTIKIERTAKTSNSCTFSISVDPNDEDFTYQWEKKDGGWNDISGATTNTYTYYGNNDNLRFRCQVGINGSDYNSQYATRTGYQNDNQYSQYSIRYTIKFNVAVDVTEGASNAVLTARCDPSVGSSVDYWWTDSSSWFNSGSLTGTSGTYYFEADVYDQDGHYVDYALSNDYTISLSDNSHIVINPDYGTPATVPAVEASYTVSSATVDYCSQMYGFLHNVAAYANVFTETGAVTKSSTLIQYLNLSKPEIVFSKDAYGNDCIPTKYTGPDGNSLSGKTLTYKFTIRNETDVTPADTRYNCNFYIDMNADGRYDYSEQLADITITDAGGNIIRSDELKAGVEYTVTRQMPDAYVGIIPWQLEVVKTTQSRVHASQHGYTHITGTAKTIYILQILDDGGGLNLTTNSVYQNLFPKVKDFNLNISTIKAGNLSGVTSGTVTRKNEDGVDETVSYANLDEYLNTFDMLILGFADCYGDLDRTSANAVVNFINNPSGKSVLFTHDTTSFVNLPFSPYPATSGTVSTSTWGYYFNTILRDSVGLDRYGVTNPNYGVTDYSPNKSVANTDGINVAAGPLSLSNVNTLASAGYSIAYEPISRTSVDSGTTKTTVSEVQGYTNYNLKRFNEYGGSTTTTTTVSQVNEGQITTYPFDLNLYGFGGNTNASDTAMTIATTHEQYYQLNMNPADIVVWYCLAGSRYANLPNDVVNAYYIYSVGNVTYSGAGHSGNSVSEDEAKLFINTMIAAYRTATTPPTLKIIDPADVTGETEMTDKFYVGDDSSLLTTSSAALADSAIYFTVTDPSLGAGKVITAAFTYDNDGTSTAINFPIYVKGGSSSPINMNSDGTAKSYTLSGGVTYYIYPTKYPPSTYPTSYRDQINAFLDYFQSNSRVQLTITITSNLLPGQPAAAAVTLHEIGLFPLD